MKANRVTYPTLILVSLILSFWLSACTTDDNLNTSKSIQYNSLQTTIALPTDLKELYNTGIDSNAKRIVQQLIDQEQISTGQTCINLDTQGTHQLCFEIIDLQKYNNNQLPVYLDSMAARVVPKQVEVLDNSTWGYPDALLYNSLIDKNDNWTNRSSAVLGTFLNAGQFQGKTAYLGFRIPKKNNYNYGWVKIGCSAKNDTLTIIEYAYNTVSNSEIKAGEIN